LARQKRRREHRFSLLFIDLNRFKPVAAARGPKSKQSFRFMAGS